MQARSFFCRTCLAFEVGLLHEADGLRRHLAVLEEEERGDAVDAVLGGEIRRFVHIHLADLDLPRLLGGDLGDERREHLARSAPRRPEVHQHRFIRLQHLGLEVDRKLITVKDIKTVGEHTALIRLHKEVSVTIPVTVVPEEAPVEEAPAAEAEAAPAEAPVDAELAEELADEQEVLEEMNAAPAE